MDQVFTKKIQKIIACQIIAKIQGSGMAYSVVATIFSDLEKLAIGHHFETKH